MNPKRAFVTSMAYSGNLGGLAGADAKCQERAQAARHPGTFRAWLSDTRASPSTRFTRGGPYLLTDNTIIAYNWTGLTTQSLLHVFNLTEFIDAPPASTIGCVNSFFPTAVWTGTQRSGEASVDVATLSCDNWTNTASIGSFWGTTNHVGSWTEWCMGGNTAAATCGTLNPLYCFEQ
jgi:hypothetical protein